MKLEVSSAKGNIVIVTTRLGYTQVPSYEGEVSFVRVLMGGPYPRFHLYVKEDQERLLYFLNLHLDQKKPSYAGAHAHSGEYDGPLVEEEMNRIKGSFQ